MGVLKSPVIKQVKPKSSHIRKNCYSNGGDRVGGLTQEDQKFARQILIDIEEKRLVINDENKTFREYITEYKCRTKENLINNVAVTFGLDLDKLSKLIERKANEKNINDFQEFDKLKDTWDVDKIVKYFSNKAGKNVKPYEAISDAKDMIKRFIIYGEITL